MFIGLISDSHGTFGPEFREFLKDVDVIWHAGDFGGGLDMEAEIAAFKPLVGVIGNCDDRRLLDRCPKFRYFKCEGLWVLMTHIGGSPGHYYPEAKNLIRQFRPDLFVCGHSHILKVMNDKDEKVLYINPGACGNQGWHAYRTALRFHIDSGKLHDMEVFELNRGKALTERE